VQLAFRFTWRALYAMHGVAEYWLVDPAAETVWVHRLRNGEPVVAHTFASGDTLCSPLLPGFALDGLGAFQRHRGQPREEWTATGAIPFDRRAARRPALDIAGQTPTMG